MRFAWGRLVSGSPTFRVSQKLKGLKGDLRRWNKEAVGNIFAESKKLEDEIASVQACDDKLGLNDTQHETFSCALVRYHNLLRQQEIFLASKV